MAIVSNGVIATRSSSAIAVRKLAMRHQEAGKRRTAATYATVSSGTMTSASGFHDHAYGSTPLR